MIWQTRRIPGSLLPGGTSFLRTPPSNGRDGPDHGIRSDRSLTSGVTHADEAITHDRLVSGVVVVGEVVTGPRHHSARGTGHSEQQDQSESADKRQRDEGTAVGTEGLDHRGSPWGSGPEPAG